MYVYIVIDYDCIEYAGTNFKEATKYIKGGGYIQIWKDGKWVGTGVYSTTLKKFIKTFT